MDLEAARKSLSKRSRFSPKRIAFGVVVGLVFVVGIGLRVRHYLDDVPPQDESAAVEAPVAVPLPAPEASPPPPAETTESIPAPPPPAETNESLPAAAPSTQEAAPAPAEPAEQVGDTAGQTNQADLPGAGMILVSRKPVEVRSGPSASAPAMYGFPAGRPFRVVGREAGFVQIQDLKSSASGWIDEAALAPPPAPARSAAAPPQSKPGAVNRKPATATADAKPKAPNKAAPVSGDSEPDPAEANSRPGLFGRGGLFGGIFGNGHGN